MNEQFQWIDIAVAGALVIQRNPQTSRLRMCQRVPIGSTHASADIPLAVGDELDALLVALAGAFGISVNASGGHARAVGFRS